jgi:PadR family transcriptional regulator, regulatory protein PadR
VGFAYLLRSHTRYGILSVGNQKEVAMNNRRARFYRLTRDGRKQLQAESGDWEQTAEIIGRFLALQAEDLR